MAEYIDQIEVTFRCRLQPEKYEAVSDEETLEQALLVLLANSTNPFLNDVEIADVTILETQETEEEEEEDEDEPGNL